MKLAIVGGTSLLKSSLFADFQPEIIQTPHGKAVVHVSKSNSSLCFVQRHHADGEVGAHVYRPPHLINHRANIAALSSLGVDAIIAICCVGSLKSYIPIGTLIIPDDYFYLFGPSVSYYDDDRAHIVPGFDLALRQKIIKALQEAGVWHDQQKCLDKAVYVQTVGPRFETKAEVRFLSGIGDIVGMTAANETTLAKEIGIPYAAVAMVDNLANGLDGSQLTHEQFKANVLANQNTVEKAVKAILDYVRW